jgi:hypothetical protein
MGRGRPSRRPRASWPGGHRGDGGVRASLAINARARGARPRAAAPLNNSLFYLRSRVQPSSKPGAVTSDASWLESLPAALDQTRSMGE